VKISNALEYWIARFHGTTAVVVAGEQPNPQAIWSIRVPWPGGRAATTGGWASVASALLSFDGSGVLAALLSVAVTGIGVVIWVDDVIAEILIGKDPWLMRQTVRGRRPRLYEFNP
jgi:hypothetical protein